jgi:hypothetical protein
MSDKPLYEDKFLTLTEWLNSATVQLVLGFALALVLFIYVNWFASFIVIIITIVGAFASYMVFKK